ncbi:BNR repeat-like domain protein [Rickettsia argasii T170-B]|uniref:BNR repeat-like domain protein n=1 Tax=Rickettsia argasii T170-B TaxID=1268837 RepID=A0A0F3R6E5_9RICK|nr:exo-alpha-sialidase [Rickettsia argasii]KJW01848.1 BNR repeat-like domain protein [Rickettsia argasii T170-B]
MSSNPQIFQKGYRGFIQPTLVTGDSQNKIIMLVRPRKTDPLIPTYIHRSMSLDKGIHWNNLEPINLLNPDSAIDAINLSSNTLLLAYNRVINHLKSRNILSLAISYDEGLNYYPIIIKNSIYPEGDIEYSNILSEEYSYPAIIMNPDNNEIHVIYTFNRINLKHKVFQLLPK